VLSLASETGSGWLARALEEIDEILVDHAHCEKKAASSALGLLFRYPERHDLLLPLAELAREELAHFAEVVRVMAARGLRLRHQVPSPYAGQLMQAVRTREPERLLDMLLCHALIEARSCERLKLLADAVPDDTLATLFRGLLASEARHHAAYVELAAGVAPAATVRARLAELAAHEAAVLATAPPLPRLHT
jgi:tRNA-(ms[2]io[6]A)-hydroxylase